MSTVDVQVLAATPGRLPSPADVEVRVAVSGLVDADGLDRLRRVCVALDSLSAPVLVDVERARTDSHLLVGVLTEFRTRRHAAGRACRVQGLHRENTPSLETMALPVLVAVHAEMLRETEEQCLVPVS